ncbi:hypothetical protein HispidOSU_008660, partial [Sigmodon hispidus]
AGAPVNAQEEQCRLSDPDRRSGCCHRGLARDAELHLSGYLLKYFPFLVRAISQRSPSAPHEQRHRQQED